MIVLFCFFTEKVHHAWNSFPLAFRRHIGLLHRTQAFLGSGSAFSPSHLCSCKLTWGKNHTIGTCLNYNFWVRIMTNHASLAVFMYVCLTAQKNTYCYIWVKMASVVRHVCLSSRFWYLPSISFLLFFSHKLALVLIGKCTWIWALSPILCQHRHSMFNASIIFISWHPEGFAFVTYFSRC